MDKENLAIAPDKATYIMANSADDGNRYWFPMRVSYGRAAQVARRLMEKDYGIKFFLPTEERTAYMNGRVGYYMLTNKEVESRTTPDGEPVSRKVKISMANCIVSNKNYDNIIEDIANSCSKPGTQDKTQEERTIQIDIPLISSLIFLYGTRNDIREIKCSEEPFTFLRYMTFTERNDFSATMSNSELWASRRIRVIPRIQMEQFMKVLNEEKNHVTLIPYNSFDKYVGKKIRFIDGPFKGQEAIIRRDGKKQNKRFLFDLGNIIVARVDYIPKQQYEIIN